MKKNPFIPHHNSQNKPDRKWGIGCAGRITVDRVRATDEWVQEAVMSDNFSSDESVGQKMPQQRQKYTGSLQAKNSPFSDRARRTVSVPVHVDNIIW